MRRNQVAVVGAAETTELGVIPNMSQIQLHADAALNAIADAGLKLSDIDGIATAVETPQQIAHYLGIKPTWVDGTSVGGCSFMLHVRHAAAAIEAGLCKTVLITHAESGKSMIGKLPRSTPPDSLNGQFESPFGVFGPPSMFPIPVLRYMKTYGITHEQIAMVAVVQREWAAKNPRATMKAPITVEDVLNSKMIAYPFRILQCCLVTDGGGALILTSADRAKDFPNKPVYILGTGESVETPMVSQMETFNSSRAFKTAGPLAFKEAGIAHKDVDHLMIYDAFAHLPLFGLGDLGFMPHEETGKFIADGNTRPGGKLPLNTNGGGLSYMHSGMYGMYALQESVRQMRGIAPAQVKDAKISVCHGVGGMFAASRHDHFYEREVNVSRPSRPSPGLTRRGSRSGLFGQSDSRMSPVTARASDLAPQAGRGNNKQDGEPPWPNHCRTKSSSSPARAAASAARSRCSAPPKAPRSWSTIPAAPPTARATAPLPPRKWWRKSRSAAARRSPISSRWRKRSPRARS